MGVVQKCSTKVVTRDTLTRIRNAAADIRQKREAIKRAQEAALS